MVRFAQPGQSSQASVTEGAPEGCASAVRSFALNDVNEPGNEGDAGDDAPLPLMTLPLDGWHRARGARMVEFAGYEMPVQYDGIIAEHLWTRESAGLFDVSHMGQLVLSGPGVADALEALLPGDISALKAGRIRYSLLLGEDGGILDDLMITALREGSFGLVVKGAMKRDDMAHLREHLPDAVTINHLDEHALLAVQGPKAADALSRLLPGAPDTLRFMQSRDAQWRGHAVRIARCGYTGEDGFEISLPSNAAAELADALVALETVKPAGLGARDSLRLEAGLPLYGHDLDDGIDPVSAGLGFAVSKSRRAGGGFPGADRILALLDEGPPCCRVGLLLDGRMAAREGAPVLAGDAQVGRVTSGGFSPTLQRPIAMGFVDAGHAAPGTALEIEMRGKRLSAAVVPLPFVPHRYHR